MTGLVTCRQDKLYLLLVSSDWLQYLALTEEQLIPTKVMFHVEYKLESKIALAYLGDSKEQKNRFSTESESRTAIVIQ